MEDVGPADAGVVVGKVELSGDSGCEGVAISITCDSERDVEVDSDGANRTRVPSCCDLTSPIAAGPSSPRRAIDDLIGEICKGDSGGEDSGDPEGASIAISSASEEDAEVDFDGASRTWALRCESISPVVAVTSSARKATGGTCKSDSEGEGSSESERGAIAISGNSGEYVVDSDSANRTWAPGREAGVMPARSRLP